MFEQLRNHITAGCTYTEYINLDNLIFIRHYLEAIRGFTGQTDDPSISSPDR